MARSKQRLTVTVDPDLVDAGNRAVTAGRAASLSAWVNEAIAAHVKRDERLAGLAEVIADYEAEYGEITEEEMAAQERADRQTAIVVNGHRRKSGAA